MIDDGAEGCGPISCGFWATGQAIYQFSSLGFAAWHDPWRDAYDSGQVNGEEYARIGIAGGGAVALTGYAAGGLLGEAIGGIAAAFGDFSSVESGTSIVGQSFGKIGTGVESPGLSITGFTEHGLDQTITRGVSPQSLLDTVNDPSAVLQQSGGQYLYLSEDAGVVLSPEGDVITTYPSSMFDDNVQSILDDAQGDD